MKSIGDFETLKKGASMRIIGIDPGQSGGAALLAVNGDILDSVAFTIMTPFDIAAALQEWASNEQCFAYIERVHSMPRQGVASTFKFGVSYGFLQGVLVGLRIPHEFVLPRIWQQALGCLSKGDKNVTKAKAQQLFSEMKITHAIADALLIAEYGRRTRK